MSVNELARHVLDVTGSTAGIEYLPMRAGETPTRIVASGEGWDTAGWRPVLDWDRITESVDWYKP